MNNQTFCSLIFSLCICIHANAQVVTSKIQGRVIDKSTESPIPFANIGITNPPLNLGTISDAQGEFLIDNVPVGRCVLQVSYIGYATLEISDVLVTSGNNPLLIIKLEESTYSLDEIVVRPKLEKEKPINNMATVSAKQINMEEANRYAGGFDDPARLVTSFAGVVGGAGDNNAVSVRGNSPKGTLWQIEGIPVPNPNHFAEITGFGGGGITALSSKTIGNSDFFMGAFPAEYGNALSSVFDLSIRTGNTSEFQHAVQAGFFGLDVGSEGPININAKSSYLFNYRYSTLALFDLGLDYQDLSFKFHFPTQKAGNFTFWGLGLIDESYSSPDPLDTLEADAKWQYYDDISTENAQLTTSVGGGGLSHIFQTNKHGYWKTVASVSYNKTYSENSRLDSTFTINNPIDKIQYTGIDYRLSSVLSNKFGSSHMNKTGILFTNINYRFNIQNAIVIGDPLTTFSADNGSSNLLQAFTQSSFTFGKFRFNPGVHFLYFALNNKYSVEPRFGLSYSLDDKTSFSLGYGLHSQIEKLSFYLADIPTNAGTEKLNKNLGLTKSHHIVFSFDRMFGTFTHLRIEPYYQYLYNVPVVNGSYFSVLTLRDEFFFNEQLINAGDGKNMGIDFTLEQFLHKGIYYMATFSLFESKYTDGNSIERSTPFNRKIVGNFLFGKEWLFRNANLFSANVRYTYLGGSWTHPVDEDASIAAKDIVEDLENAYTIQNPTAHVVSFTVTYRVNKEKHASLWSLQMLNVSGAKEYLGYQYNFRTNSIDPNYDVVVLPNLSYRFEF